MNIIDIALSRKGGNVPVVSSGGADWNAVEGEDGYIANKPFGEIEYGTLYEGEVTIAAPDMSHGNPGGTDIGTINIEPGMIYTVEFDGEIYNVECKKDNYDRPYIGNQTAYAFWRPSPVDTGEPFLYIKDLSIFAKEGYTSRSLTIKVSGAASISKIGPYSGYFEGHLVTSGTGLSSDVFNNTENIASGMRSHAEGNLTTASGAFSHAEGSGTTASSSCSHAEGDYTVASSQSSHAEGQSTTASGDYSHAEGANTIAGGSSSHAEGSGTTASGSLSHAEGQVTTASGNDSHAEGRQTVAMADYSHAEGVMTQAGYSDVNSSSGQTVTIGEGAHAEGYQTVAGEDYSHAEGMGTLAGGRAQHVGGLFNIPDDSSLEIIGNGADESDRSNARTLDRNGNEWLAGNLTVSSAITIGSTTLSERNLQDLLAILK